MRVYEYAKQTNVSSKDIISTLQEMDVEVSNHMSTIEDNVIVKLDQKFNTGNKKNTSNELTKKTGNQVNNTNTIQIQIQIQIQIIAKNNLQRIPIETITDQTKQIINLLIKTKGRKIITLRKIKVASSSLRNLNLKKSYQAKLHSSVV
jgi:translation initiation factor IF-2